MDLFQVYIVPISINNTNSMLQVSGGVDPPDKLVIGRELPITKLPLQLQLFQLPQLPPLQLLQLLKLRNFLAKEILLELHPSPLFHFH